MYYDDIAKGYDELHGEEQLVKLNHIWETLGKIGLLPEKGQMLLDVGCGTGISSDFFAKKGMKVIGIDPAKELIAQNLRKKSDLMVGSAEQLPFPDVSFDFVVSVTAIQNFSDIRKGLEEIKRVSRGNCALTVLHRGKNAQLADDCIHELFSVVLVDEDSTDRYYFISA